PLLWYDARRGTIRSTGADGLPLGVMDPLEITPAPPVQFEPGDMGIFLTDGFIEAQDAEGKYFGKERVEGIIIQNDACPAAELIATLEAAVRDFIHTSPQLDDLTAVVVKRRG